MENEKDPELITFKTEQSLWDMMARGVKKWDARRYDMADDRIYRLSWSLLEDGTRVKVYGRPELTTGLMIGKPEVKQIAFLNKKTGETLVFEYKGMEFSDWSPAWCFLILGELLARTTCPGVNACQKIDLVMDKDCLDSQKAEAIRAVCAKCEEHGR